MRRTLLLTRYLATQSKDRDEVSKRVEMVRKNIEEGFPAIAKAETG